VTCGERTGGGRGSRATRTDWRQLSGAGRPLRADYHQGSGEWCSGQRQMSWSNSLLRVCLCLLGLRVPVYTTKILSMFVSLVYCAESTVRWFVVREKHCWIAADSVDKSKRTGRSLFKYRRTTHCWNVKVKDVF
jgi:hypothetical protein